MSEEINRLYSEAEKRLRQERDKTVEKIREEISAAKQNALSK